MRVACAFTTWLLTAASVCNGQTGIITTVAGASVAAGDGRPALEALIFFPEGLATDGAGNLYIADSHNHRVRKLTPDGLIRTVAGTGIPGFSGDGGAATATQLYLPSGVALDSSGNLYIADSQNHRVRKVSPAGVITTVAGTGVAGWGGDNGPALRAELNYPVALALDAAGNLYLADSNNHWIRKVTPQGVITSVAGIGAAGFKGDGGPGPLAQLNTPTGLAIDRAGNLYIADQTNHRIRKVTSDGVITTIAGSGVAGSTGDGGPAAQAQLSSPRAVACDELGNLYVADHNNERIRKVSAAGVITTVAGTGTAGAAGDRGPAVQARLNGPRGVALDGSGSLYIADADNFRIRKVAPDGTITALAGTMGQDVYYAHGGVAADARVFFPWGVATDPAGNVYSTDQRGPGGTGSVRSISPSGVIRTLARPGHMNGVTAGPDGGVYVVSSASQKVLKVTPDGTVSTVAGTGTQGFAGDGGPAAQAQLSNPVGVALDSAGNLYIADRGNQRIRKVTPGGVITTVAGSGTAGFAGDGGPALEARLYNPNGLAVDAAGNLYIADNVNNRIRKVSPAGIITTVAGGGSLAADREGVPATTVTLTRPVGVAIDEAGNLYITDTNNHRIRKVNSAGIITTIAGTGKPGYGGDGGPATAASLNAPYGIAADALGNLYVADYNNDRIRKIAFLLEVATASPLPAGVVWTPYSQSLVALGGAPPYRWSVSEGALPPGLTLDAATGTLGGAPALGGTFKFTVRAADSAGATSAKEFTLTITAPVMLSRSIVSFAYQTGEPLPAAQTVSVTTSGPAVNFTVNVSDAPWLSASPTSGATPAVLSLTVNPEGLKAGIYVGTLTVRAADVTQVLTVQLVVSAPGSAPQFSAAGVVNAASLSGAPVAPGEIVTLFGSGLGPAAAASFQLIEGQMATSVAETQVFFDNIPAPLVYVQANQVNAIVPYAVAGTKETKVQVQYKGLRSSLSTVPVAPSAPGIFTSDASGKGPGAILNQDYTVNSAANPAAKGSVVLIYATGEGETDPQVADGWLASSQVLPRPKLPVAVKIGGLDAEVLYAGAAPGMVVGLLQVNVRVPSAVASGSAVPVVLTVGTAVSQPGVTMAVR